jgi:uncharacterized repeat protein (TIGR01451 family)
MKNIFTSKFKKIAAIVAASLTLAGTAFISPQALASGPFFNRLQGDREMLMAKISNTTTYADPLSAKTTDKVTVAVYIHNGGDGVARNTRVSLAPLTSGEVSTHKIKSAVWADNADKVTETIVNGQIVGAPDLTLNLDGAANLSYVPGSTKWYPDYGANQNQTGIIMPDEIMSANGLLLGDVDYCWDHVGYVLADFIFTSTPQEVRLETNKWVIRNGGDNNQWVKENSAQPNDTLRYMVYYNNAGNGNALNSKIVDQMPVGVTYQPNSMSKRVKDANNNDIDIPVADSSLTIAGQNITIPLGTVLPGQGNSGYITFSVKVNSLPVGTHVLVNHEDLSASNAATVSSSAQTTVIVTPTPVVDLHILKEVANLSSGTTIWSRENTAQPGDHMQYRLSIYNQGNTAAENVSVKDILPNYLTYVTGSTKIYTTASPNSGTQLPDGITVAGVNIGRINPGVPDGNKYIIFEVTVSTDMGSGNYDLINKGEVYISNIKKDESTAKTTVTAERGLLLTKEVWNPATSNWVSRLEGVKPGNQVIFKIMVRNTGTTVINNPLIKDLLPQYLTYINGSTQMDGSVSVDDAWITQNTGIGIANVVAGGFKVITFKATVGACPPGGGYTVTNRATVVADGFNEKSASADVVIVAGPPVLPQ